jgi:hypothetical protein
MLSQIQQLLFFEYYSNQLQVNMIGQALPDQSFGSLWFKNFCCPLFLIQVVFSAVAPFQSTCIVDLDG